MADLSYAEKLKLERVLDMGGGYVLNFSNRTFHEFIFDCVGIDIYDSKYDYSSGSKANRMRAFWDLEPNHIVGKLLEDIFTNWDEFGSSEWDDDTGDFEKNPIPEDCLRIVERLKSDAIVPEIDAVAPNIQEKDFEILAQSVREHIKKNEPEVGLDRLHTFLVKYFRVLCRKHGISTERRKPLHSLVGEYVRKLKNNGHIESEMTERILKSSISVMEAFNRVRNEQSYAHDNKVINYSEALLIFNYVTSSIRFVEYIENLSKVNSGENQDEEPIDDLPF